MSVADFNLAPELAETKSQALKRAVKTIEDALDTSVNPCEDFKSYACGKYAGASTFSDVFLSTIIKQVQHLRKGSNEKGPKALVFNYWNQCVKALNNARDTLGDGKLPKALVADLEQASGFKFPLLNGAPNKKLTLDALSHISGYLAGKHAGSTPFVQTLIFSKIKDPKHGYRLYLDGPSGIINPVYLQDPLFDIYRGQIVDLFVAPLRNYANAIGAVLDDDDIQTAAEELAELERILARGATDNPGLESIDNPYTKAQASKQFGDAFNIKSYLEGLAGNDEYLTSVFSADNYQFAIASPRNWRVFTSALKARKFADGSDISDSTLINMVFFRLLYFLSPYLPPSLAAQASPAVRFGRHVERPAGLPEPSLKRAEFEIPDWHPMLVAAGVSRPELQCAQLSGQYLEFANDRVFVEAVYPADRRDDIQDGVFEMADNIAKEFRGLLQSLAWLDATSRKAALEKVDNIQKNIIWPSIVFNDTALKAYYQNLPDLSNADWLKQQAVLDSFVRNKELHTLGASSYDRSEFGDTSVTNAYYRPNANSITILGGIVQAPFYDIDWPPALQYGAVGMAVGHEITHGFDNSGVFWDKDGALKPETWMSAKSRREFDKMAKCVIDEYDGLCLKSKRENKEYCDNGAGTQGENIADNGGIRSGFLAYKAYEAKHGVSPPLPGKVAGTFSNDQLFFIAFARTWCDNADAADYPWENEHSPAPLRIFGTLQNYDQFQKTFNCPIGSPYAPAKHCEVWHTPGSSSAFRAKFAGARNATTNH